MTPEEEEEAQAELERVLSPIPAPVNPKWVAALIWKNRATIHHILTKYGRRS